MAELLASEPICHSTRPIKETMDVDERQNQRQKLRVCVLAACPFPANHGTPGSIREMSEALADEGHEVHIVTYHFGEDIEVRGPRLHRIRRLTNESQVVVGPTLRRPLYDLQMAFEAIRVTRKYGIEVIHAHGYEAALGGWLCRLVTGVPMVYSAHNTMADELPSYGAIRPKFLAQGLAKLLDAIVPRLAHRCLPHSENIRQFLNKSGLARRTDAVVNFGIEFPVDEPDNESRIPDEYQMANSKIVLYAGVMDRFQRLDLLFDAMAHVVNRFPDAQLCMVQTVPNQQQLDALRQRVQELGLESHVVFTPPQSLEGVRRFLTECDVAVVPRPQTPGFPIKLLNYMAAGKPAVLFNSSASGLTHGENAYLIDEDTSEALAEGILDLLSNPVLCQRLGRLGKQFVHEKHDRRVVARHIAETYRTTIAGQRKSKVVQDRKLRQQEAS